MKCATQTTMFIIEVKKKKHDVGLTGNVRVWLFTSFIAINTKECRCLWKERWDGDGNVRRILAVKCMGSLDQTTGERRVISLSISFIQQTPAGDGRTQRSMDIFQSFPCEAFRMEEQKKSTCRSMMDNNIIILQKDDGGYVDTDGRNTTWKEMGEFECEPFFIRVCMYVCVFVCMQMNNYSLCFRYISPAAINKTCGCW